MKILIKGDPEKERKREKRERFVKEGKQNHIYKRSSSGWTEDPFFLHNRVFLVFYLAFLLIVINFSSLSSQYPTHFITNSLWWAHWATIWPF